MAIHTALHSDAAFQAPFHGHAGMLRTERITQALLKTDPYPHVTGSGLIGREHMADILRDFPRIGSPGFFPLSILRREGAFDDLLRHMESELAEALTHKLGLELRDKPHMVTVRKWSAAKDGRIHNDGEAKIATCLIYLNANWPEHVDGGRLRILRSNERFDDAVSETSPEFGNFVAFRRTENSWHGHKPFLGERRVVQMTWLRSWDDFRRKSRHGRFSYHIKKLMPLSYLGVDHGEASRLAS